MKAGTTASKYIVFSELDTEYVDNIIFTFKSIFGSVKKIYPQNVVLEYGRFRIDFTQEDTLIFSPLGTKVEVKCEAQINYKGGAVQKSTCGSWDLESTLATQLIVGNKSDGAESDAIELVLQEEVIVVENTNGSSSGNLLNYVTKDDLNDYAKLTDIPTTLPASDVYDWAKSETKPEYTADEVGALPINTSIPSIEGLATEEYVTSKINEAQLSGGDVDLSIYYTKTETYSKTEVDELVSSANNGESGNSSSIVYISETDYLALVANGTYNPNTIYITEKSLLDGNEVNY